MKQAAATITAIAAVAVLGNANPAAAGDTVPVIYEPAQEWVVADGSEMRPVEPHRDDYGGRWTATYHEPHKGWWQPGCDPTGTQAERVLCGYSPGTFHNSPLPPNTLLPTPDPPAGGVYESVLTPTTVAATTTTIRAWRWAGLGGDYRRQLRAAAWAHHNGDAEACPPITQNGATTAGADCTVAYLAATRGWYVDPQIAARHGDSRLIAIVATLVTDGTTPAQIPRFACHAPGRRGADDDGNATCELHPDHTLAALQDLRAADPTGLAAFVAAYTTTETADAIDWSRVQAQEQQYESDLARIVAHNTAVQAAAWVDTYICDAACEAAYQAAVDDYDAWVEPTVDRVRTAAYRDYLDARARLANTMHVDCRQTGCVLVNPHP